MKQDTITIDELVRQAEAIVLEYFQGSESSKDTIGNTQLSNAIDVIVQSKSVEVFCNWLRYQMARESRESSDQKGFWTTPERFAKEPSENESLTRSGDPLVRLMWRTSPTSWAF
jgi:hypothetical protein